jgi:5-methylcytosine-specific restriction endonuclease McrA
MDDEVKQFVRQRADNHCEYCKVHQRYYPDFAFHVEHIIARQHRGPDNPDNLALACHLCNNKKGPNLSGIDPATGELTRLFNPRADVWNEHFRLEESGFIMGLTPIGRTTVYVLGMNTDLRIQIRLGIAQLGS